MKKCIFRFLFASVFILFISCDETFNPKGEFQDGYSLYCIIDLDQEIQKVYLFENYMPEGFNAESYNENRTVENAEVKINDGNKDFIFTDTTEFIESFGYNVTYYRYKNFNPSNGILNITAVIPGKKMLAGSTNVYTRIPIFNSTSRRDLQYEPLKNYEIGFVGNNPFEFLPALFINYSIIQNGDTVDFKKEIPASYFSEGGKLNPTFPDLEERTRFDYKISVIETAIKELAKDHPGQNIIIKNMTLSIITVSSPLNTYYKSNKTNLDGFSIKLIEPNISNIINGNGIFAAKKISSIKVNFAQSWEILFGELGFSF